MCSNHLILVPVGELQPFHHITEGMRQRGLDVASIRAVQSDVANESPTEQTLIDKIICSASFGMQPVISRTRSPVADGLAAPPTFSVTKYAFGASIWARISVAQVL